MNDIARVPDIHALRMAGFQYIRKIFDDDAKMGKTGAPVVPLETGNFVDAEFGVLIPDDIGVFLGLFLEDFEPEQIAVKAVAFLKIADHEIDVVDTDGL